jgi:hypothetical protein
VQGVRCKDQGPRTKNRGLLRQIRMDQARKADLRGPEPSAARLGPRGFSTGVVDSLGEGFVWGGYRYSRSNFKLNCAAAIDEWLNY